MTTIAFKLGVVATDSRVTVESEAGGIRSFNCQKLWRKKALFNGREQEMIFATAGEGPSGQLFVEKYGDDKLTLNELRDTLVQGGADFTILVLCEDGLYEVNQWCTFEKVIPTLGCYAIGSGSKVAMGAMLAGKNAKQAVEIACIVDPHTFGPIVTMKLKNGVAKKAKKVKAKTEKPNAQAGNGHVAVEPAAADQPEQ